jgi:alcohol dehydrogenase class IV
MAFSQALVGLVHGMAHPLSAYCDVQHGLANAILLPRVLAFNAPTCEAQLARVAEALGQRPEAQAAIDAIWELSNDVCIPQRLSDVGVSDEFILQMAQDAADSGNAQVVNPRKPCLSDVIELYRQAL